MAFNDLLDEMLAAGKEWAAQGEAYAERLTARSARRSRTPCDACCTAEQLVAANKAVNKHLSAARANAE